MEKKYNNSMYTPAVTYTYPGKLNTDLITKPKIETPALSEFGRIIQGIRCGEYIHLVQPLATVLSKSSGDCNPTYTQSGSITDRKLETGKFVINLEWCEAEFTAVCNALSDSSLVGDGVDAYELSGKLQSVIFEEVLEAARQDIWKVILFGQNAFTESSIYSEIDGVWTKFFDSFASYCTQPISNAFPNAYNSTLNPDQARDILRLMWGNSNILLKQMPNNQKVFWVTGSVWENYYDSVINNCCVEGSWKASQDGIGKLYYRGIELKPLWIADQALQEGGNPYYNTLRHFIIYTTPANHMIGVERASDLNNLTMCFDCRTNSNLIKGKMRFGYNFAQCDLQSIAY
jgi:hypothetical protein